MHYIQVLLYMIQKLYDSLVSGESSKHQRKVCTDERMCAFKKKRRKKEEKTGVNIAEHPNNFEHLSVDGLITSTQVLYLALSSAVFMLPVLMKGKVMDSRFSFSANSRQLKKVWASSNTLLSVSVWM